MIRAGASKVERRSVSSTAFGPVGSQAAVGEPDHGSLLARRTRRGRPGDHDPERIYGAAAALGAYNRPSEPSGWDVGDQYRPCLQPRRGHGRGHSRSRAGGAGRYKRPSRHRDPAGCRPLPSRTSPALPREAGRSSSRRRWPTRIYRRNVAGNHLATRRLILFSGGVDQAQPLWISAAAPVREAFSPLMTLVVERLRVQGVCWSDNCARIAAPSWPDGKGERHWFAPPTASGSSR